jgi:hypothetical protein
MRKRAIVLCLLSACSIFDTGTGRPFAVWSVHGTARPAGTCATIQPIVAKSGAEGVGFILVVDGKGSCTLALAAMEMRLEDEAFQRPLAFPPAAVTPGGMFRVYAPIAFDHRRAWNRGARSATFVVRGTIDGQTFESGPWTMDDIEVHR